MESIKPCAARGISQEYAFNHQNPVVMAKIRITLGPSRDEGVADSYQAWNRPSSNQKLREPRLMRTLLGGPVGDSELFALPRNGLRCQGKMRDLILPTQQKFDLFNK